MHSHFSAEDHQGISHVIARIAHVHQFHAFYSAQMFPDRQKVSQHLCGMVFICKAIPHGNTCVFCQFLHDLLSESAVFNSVIDSSQNPGSVTDTLFLADLGAFWIQIGGSHSQVVGCHLKGTASPGAGLFKDKSYISAL